eukprot:NODE_8689_length_656_cov_23.624765_g8064_i0.p1 GENE.NODE_8689_length_656_cov_23.624765_g8064_i0~~NODE_8689_length_656_cov_23.624765_g8064_i0.p1  ORF type:complete len:202 (-),score=41.41 NODE_8689_length_656_cov_23.624765_g8064_i0:50-601(-)
MSEEDNDTCLFTYKGQKSVVVNLVFPTTNNLSDEEENEKLKEKNEKSRKLIRRTSSKRNREIESTYIPPDSEEALKKCKAVVQKARDNTVKESIELDAFEKENQELKIITLRFRGYLGTSTNLTTHDIPVSTISKVYEVLPKVSLLLCRDTNSINLQLDGRILSKETLFSSLDLSDNDLIDVV